MTENTFGNEMKPSPDELCPCGSGEKYKDCCGKELAAKDEGSMKKNERILGVIAILASLTAIITLLVGSMMIVPMPVFAKNILIPGMVILGFVTVMALRCCSQLGKAIIIGALAGFVATIGLDIVRLSGVSLGLMPNLPPMFGSMMTGLPPETSASVTIGYIHHFLNGITFGIIYAVIFGRIRWFVGVGYGLFVELGMMISPPMVMMAGFFGLKMGYSILVVSLIAHIVFGAVLGLLVQRYTPYEGLLFSSYFKKLGWIVEQEKPTPIAPPPAYDAASFGCCQKK